MRYFPLEINGTKELKTIYKVLSKKYHPDMGGNEQSFVEMKLEYDFLLKRFENGYDAEANKDLIDELFKTKEEKGYKSGWVYFTFKDLAKDPTHSDFKYLAEVLSYKEGWAYFKWKEYEDEIKF